MTFQYRPNYTIRRVEQILLVRNLLYSSYCIAFLLHFLLHTASGIYFSIRVLKTKHSLKYFFQKKNVCVKKNVLYLTLTRQGCVWRRSKGLAMHLKLARDYG